MPFVQRVVQPVNLAQARGNTSCKLKFRCMPGKCKNNNCINRLHNNIVNGSSEDNNSNTNTKDTTIAKQQLQQQQQQTKTVIKAIVHTTSTSTIQVEREPQPNTTQLNGGVDTFVTSPLLPATYKRAGAPLVHSSNLTNGFAASFTYATDTEEDIVVAAQSTTTATTPLSPSALRSPTTTGILPNMKKLKQHVEFLDTGCGSTPTSPTRSLSRSSAPGGIGGGGGGGGSASSSRATSRERSRRSVTAANSPTSAKIVTGFEFDSISNITLSNALRQLASLVLIASDIFDDLQNELQQVGERARVVQRKIVAVERRVYSYDPKKVTVPESDLFTFAQRKTHYDSEKACQQELFTATTRPHSVRVLYEDAGKKTPPPQPLTTTGTAASTPRSTSFTSADGLLNSDDVDADIDAMLDLNDTGAGVSWAAGSDELVCTPVFGRANRKMRTRIDAEIEIRLPAAIEDLRKWTSSEALGDVTVTPDCMHHVDTSISTSIVIGDNGVLTPALSPSVLSADAVDALYSINVSNVVDSAHITNDLNKDVPLNHRLPSPEEQCKIIALRYPAEVVSVDTSGKRFERMCLARKSTTGCYNHPTPSMGQGSSAGSSAADGSSTAANNLNEDIQTVSRRSRSRKVRGKRRNTIAGTDQKEIQIAANGDSTIASIGEIKHTTSTQRAGSHSHSSSGSRQHDKSKKFGRSKSSDILKKESVALPYDKGKNTLTRLNSLKQWGRNRFKFMQRNDASSIWLTNGGSSGGAIGDVGGNNNNTNSNNNNGMSPLSNTNNNNNENQQDVLATCSNSSNSPNTSIEKAESTTTAASSTTTTSHSSVTLSTKTCSIKTVNSSGRGTVNNDDECNMHDELNSQKSEARFSHERKPSYSSSEKSMSVSSTGHLRGKLHLNATASCSNAVKLRDTASLNRQRRNGISTTNGFGGKEEQPHSSSGNWSASSESGRASIGSEITMQPKSSASNTSLNVSSFHPSSGPPSSMMSRRRFLNTSASSSVTSEGTATPELHDGAYPNHLDDETSSAYSCDTEGYYTSFHMDSGLRTLKEEEPTLTPLQQQSQGSLITSNYSFGSQSNQTVLSAENEYELFGRGSTSTTTSSAGTVCTTLMINGSVGDQSSLNNLGPDVPERVSSLSKQSNSSLERSYSSSTSIGSTLERTGTIKRNVNASSLKLVTTNENDLNVEQAMAALKLTETPESQEDEFNFKRDEQQQQQQQQQRLRKRAAQPLPEIECSESSDLEGVERIERIKQKTAINARRIPSMCIITPTTSDDENPCNGNDTKQTEKAYDPNRTLTNEEEQELVSLTTETVAEQTNLKFILNEATGYCTIEKHENTQKKSTPKNTQIVSAISKDYNLNHLNTPATNNDSDSNVFFGKLKVVLPSIKRSSIAGKSSPTKQPANSVDVLNNDDLYDTAGEYVTIADISNNNRRKNQLTIATKPVSSASSSLGIYYSNDIVRRQHTGQLQPQTQQNQLQQQQGNEPKIRETEYVSLNELPIHLRKRVLMPPSSPASGLRSNKALLSANNKEASKLEQKQQNCADADLQRERNKVDNDDNNDDVVCYDDCGLVSMYAEISEIRDLSTQSRSPTPTTATTAATNATSSSSSSQSQHKGPRVRVNSQGKFIYDSDSLKRRKGAHTTFAPGPYVKETESALPDLPIQQSSSESVDSTNIDSIGSKIAKTTAAAKLLFLNGGPAAQRKVANVRPIVSRTPTRITTPTPAPMPTTTTYQQQKAQQQQLQQHHQTTYNAFIQQQQQQQQQQHEIEQKNLLANHTNPFFQQPSAVAATATINNLTTNLLPAMMPSPSTKSTSSTGSTISSSASTHTSGSTSSTEEGYQRFYRPNEKPAAQALQYQNQNYAINGQRQQTLADNGITNEATSARAPTGTAAASSPSPFQRNTPVYWTLQNRRQTKLQPSSVTCRDDLYATPIRRSERMARATAVAAAGMQTTTASSSSCNSQYISPIVPRGGGFSTSTPTKAEAEDANAPERHNTCADRIGQSKTSLMDFKKLLLAKSTKTNPIQKKLSAVEILKKNASNSSDGVSSASQAIAGAGNAHGQAPTPTNAQSSQQQLNSSMKLLDLSGSPKTFANRRMLRQGQFGSPSKTFAPKLKPNSAAAAWRNNNIVPRTDIMSTTIPEANSEEDHSNTSGGSNSSRASSITRENCSEADAEQRLSREASAERDPHSLSYDLKRNIFVQADENNFMRGEFKQQHNFGRNSNNNSPKPVMQNSMPALETAL